MKLIDKDALVAEIERRIKFFTEESGNSNSDIVIALFGLKSFLDTFEVKEVDLEKLREIARHLIAVKENIEDMRLYEEEWFILEKLVIQKDLKHRKKHKVMTQEEKQLLIQDLSARLPYKTYVKTTKGIGYIYAINTSQLIELSVANDSEYWSEVFNIDEIKPYLRPMSSMTEEEKKELLQISNFNPDVDGICYDCICCIERTSIDIVDIANFISWLNKNMFDYRWLIEKGLALEAHDGMYNIKQ